jgi:SAM-dependent methyltransferase
MNDFDKELIIQRYADRFKQYGVDIKTLASGNRERQLLRFKIFSEIGKIDGHSVLDLGCGFGDFYQYLKDQGIQVDYTGIDICPPFIEACRQRFPEAHFKVADIQKDDLGRRFDYIVCSQVYNNKLQKENNEEVMRDVIRKGFALCDIAFAVDMITKYVDYQEEKLHYYSPEEIFAFCKGLTKRVMLRHDYPLFEFMVCLYRDFQGWGKSG